MDITKWNDTWRTIDWVKDPEDKVLKKITDFYHAGVDFNAKFEKGFTPIIAAAMFSPSVKVIDLLIDGGADPNLTDEDGNTVLHWAALWSKLEKVKCLVNHCPKNFVNVKNKKGDTALDYAECNPDVAEYLKACMKDSLQQTLSDAMQGPNKMSLLKDAKTR